MSFFETETSSRNKNLLAIGISLSNIFKIQTEVNPLKNVIFQDLGLWWRIFVWLPIIGSMRLKLSRTPIFGAHGERRKRTTGSVVDWEAIMSDRHLSDICSILNGLFIWKDTVYESTFIIWILFSFILFVRLSHLKDQLFHFEKCHEVDYSKQSL